VFKVATPISTLESSANGRLDIFNDLGSGASYGSQTGPLHQDLFTPAFNAAGLSALRAAIGGQFAVGGAITSLAGSDSENRFGNTRGSNDGTDTKQLVLTYDVGEYYAFHLDAGQSATLAVTSLDAGQLVHEELLDSSGNLLALGSVGPTNVGEVINNFVAPVSDTYYVRISSDSATHYSLVVTRNAAFDVGNNGTQPTAQDLGGTAGALGYLAPPATSAAVVPGGLANSFGNHFNGFPFSTYDTYVSQMHYQQIYDHGQFGSGGVITAIRFRRAAGQPTFSATTISAAISLAYARTTVATVSPTFANNVGTGGLVTVCNGTTMISSTGSGSPFDIVINLTTPFTYDPSKGDLLLDIKMFNEPVTAYFDASGFGQQNVTTRVTGFDLFSQNGTINFDGTPGQPYGLVTRFDFAVPGVQDEWYKFTATAGQTLSLATYTPGDGGGAFVNHLAPHFQLYAPNGTTLVASGVVGPDGHNERITYTVPAGAGGTYYLHILSANSQTGEFFLDPEETAPGSTPESSPPLHGGLPATAVAFSSPGEDDSTAASLGLPAARFSPAEGLPLTLPAVQAASAAKDGPAAEAPLDGAFLLAGLGGTDAAALPPASRPEGLGRPEAPAEAPGRWAPRLTLAPRPVESLLDAPAGRRAESLQALDAVFASPLEPSLVFDDAGEAFV
jgi:hypothetical protein